LPGVNIKANGSNRKNLRDLSVQSQEAKIRSKNQNPGTNPQGDALAALLYSHRMDTLGLDQAHHCLPSNEVA
jgi:hypothetical protein